MPSRLLQVLLLGVLAQVTTVFSFISPSSTSTSTSASASTQLFMGQQQEQQELNDIENNTPSRRSFFQSAVKSTTAAFFLSTTSSSILPSIASAEEETEKPTVQTPLYSILRVREATEQEARLIKSGKFKDVQRANVKLAVRFMVDNYRLNDNFIAASAYLSGEKKVKAADIGQNTVQNLITILEYFDSSDVENIRVSTNGLAGKEAIVLSGLSAAKRGIDDFVALFPKDQVAAVVARIEAENELNRQEFDAELGAILNPKPPAPTAAAAQS